MQLNCPHCNYQPAIRAWRKLYIGPAISTACQHCGGKISVSWLTLLEVIPFLAGFWMAQLLHETSMVLAIACGLTGFVLVCVLHLWCVPLVNRVE